MRCFHRPALADVILLVAVCLVLPLCAPASAQEWRGDARARGVVLDADGEPMAGAQVRLKVFQQEVGPPPVTTGADGGWTVPFLAPGLYTIQIEGAGHLPAEGWVRVPEEGVPEPVRVEMQSLDVVTPSFAEGDPAGSVRRWLDVGDARLANGRPGDAREEYLKALHTPGVLEPGARAELLSTIARTHFLEGDAPAAEKALRAALVVAPQGSAEAARVRQLYTLLLENAGRKEDADRFLARLEDDRAALQAEVADLLSPSSGSEDEDGGDEDSGPPERPVLPPQEGRVGRFQTRFEGPAAASPLSGAETFLERYGVDRAAAEQADPDGLGYDLSKETFEVYVPESYEPGAGWGLLVWVSPTVFGGTERPDVQKALADDKLIWIGANRSGNGRTSWDRSGLALDAAHAMAGLYDLDPERVYVAGYSGGGRIASGLALHFPEVFRGSFSVYGVSWFEPVPVSDKPGAHWPPGFGAPPDEVLRRARADGRFVLLTGSRDFNKPQTRAVRTAMEDAGFAHVVYLEVPGASHYDLPEGEWWLRAFRALDSGAGPGAGSGEG